MSDQHTFAYPPELLARRAKQKEDSLQEQQRIHQQRQQVARDAEIGAGITEGERHVSIGIEILPDAGGAAVEDIPAGYTPPQPPQSNVRGVNSNEANPTISPALQVHIQRRLQEAEAMKNPFTTEVVHPYGAVLPNAEPPQTPTKQVSGTSLSLPSRFAFYQFKDLYVGKLKTKHYGKLHESHIAQSYSALVEVISDICSTSTPECKDMPLAFYLTVPDFYFIMFYLRLNQVRTPLTHSTYCDNPEHILAVSNKKLSEESLKIDVTVDKTFLHTNILGSVPSQSAYHVEATDEHVAFRLRPSRMIDVVDSINYPEYATDADFRYSCRVASMIEPVDNQEAPFAERLEIAANLEYDELLLIGEFEKLASAYGTQEFINVTCKECGHQRRTKVTLDARSFLPIR